MKNKPVTYFLIAAVIGLWGVIIYRVINAYSGDNDSFVPEKPVLHSKRVVDDYTGIRDTTHLLLNYRNPFETAKKETDPEIPVTKLISKLPVAPHVAQIKTPVNWSFITYSGYVRNSKSKKLLAIVNIRGIEYMMAEGETNAQVKLIKNFKDSIKITFQGESKFIAMNNK